MIDTSLSFLFRLFEDSRSLRYSLANLKTETNISIYKSWAELVTE